MTSVRTTDSLVKALGVESPSVVALIGSGGKTTLMFALTDELTRLGRCAVSTTTTKIFPPTENQARRVEVIDDETELIGTVKRRLPSDRHLTCGREIVGGKLIGVRPETVDEMFRLGLADVIVVEADGSRRLPLKACGPGEPVIPQTAGLVVAVVGLSGLGRPLGPDTVFRDELFAAMSGLEPGGAVQAGDVARAVFHPEGHFKRNPDGARVMVFLNQADAVGDAAAEQAAENFLEAGRGVIDRVVRGAMEKDPKRFQILHASGEDAR